LSLWSTNFVCYKGIRQAKPISAQGFNEGGVTFGPKDFRFTTKGKHLYAAMLGWP
jgi:alpha-L-fucosidase